MEKWLVPEPEQSKYQISQKYLAGPEDKEVLKE